MKMIESVPTEYEATEKETWTKPSLKKMDIEETAFGITIGTDGSQSGS